MDDLKAQWGDPPKPNMWKVREHHHGSNNDYVAVVSPILKNNGEFFIMRNNTREKQEWEIRYHDRFHRPLFIKRLKETHSFLEIRYYFLSSVCWSKDIGPFLRDNQNFFADGFSTKVASPVLKAKKIKHRAMWGDPLKSNMWKVESRYYAGGGEEFSFCSVESPVLKEGSFFQLMFDNSSKKWAIQYSGSTTFHVHTFHNTKKFLEARDIFLSQKGWEIIKAFALIAGIDFFRTKVASSSKLEAQWGDPPKPNMWKVKEHKYRGENTVLEVTSPILSKGSHFSVSNAFNDLWDVQFSEMLPSGKIKRHHVRRFGGSYFYNVARDRFLSQEGWSWIKDWWVHDLEGGSNIFNTKVASSDGLKAKWGNPVKTNLWKVEEHRDAWMGDYVEVTSPLLGKDRAILLTSPAYNASRFYQIEIDLGDDNVRVITGYTSVCSYQKALRLFLSPKGWRVIHTWASKQSKPVFTTKVASSSELEAQWGNPAKPNMWKVEEYEEFVEITSPVLGEGSFLLTSPAYNGTHYYQIEYQNEKRHIRKLVMEVSSYPYENALKWFLGKTFWNWHLKKWVSEQSFPVFATNKVASSDFQVMWGDPPKPNMWKIDIIKDEVGDPAYFEVKSPILGRGAIRLTDGDFNGREQYQIEWLPHPSLKSKVIAELDEFIWLNNALQFFLSPEGWRLISDWASNQSKPVFTTKVASSSDLQVMWGDPPKPNMWKIEEGVDGRMDYYEVKSPVIGKGAIRLIEYGVDDQYWRIEWKPHPASKTFRVIANLDEATNEGDEALEIFLSPEGWRLIKKWVSKTGEQVFRGKVASQKKG